MNTVETVNKFMRSQWEKRNLRKLESGEVVRVQQLLRYRLKNNKLEVIDDTLEIVNGEPNF